jgi:osmotically-inducible protein OsmY
VVPSAGELCEPGHRTTNNRKEKTMKYTKALAIAILAGATLAGTGCSVMRGQETAGNYVDDTSITTAIKAKFVEDKTVDAAAIKVETLNGTVQLSGFAKSQAEKQQAENIARNTKGVRSVENKLTVRP